MLLSNLVSNVYSRLITGLKEYFGMCRNTPLTKSSVIGWLRESTSDLSGRDLDALAEGLLVGLLGTGFITERTREGARHFQMHDPYLDAIGTFNNTFEALTSAYSIADVTKARRDCAAAAVAVRESLPKDSFYEHNLAALNASIEYFRAPWGLPKRIST